MKKLIWIFAAAFVFRLILAFIVWHPDVNNHIDWGIRFWEYGPAKFFAPETNVWSYTWPNQPPGTIYTFALIRKLFEAVFAGFWWINVKVPVFPSGIVTFFETNLYPALLKLPSILADLGIAYVLYKWTNKRLAAILWLFNPIVWYNSAVWGQTDALVNFFAILSFYLLTKKKLLWAVLAMGLSLYTKASLLIFLPIFVIVALRQKYKIGNYVSAAVWSLLAVGVLTLPFSQGNPLTWLYELYVKKVFVQQLHVITANAFNIWSVVAGIHERPDSLPFLGLTYRYWGNILFGIFFVPILYSVYKKQDLSAQAGQKNLVWALALTAFASWMLLTNMHERYLYPLFPYLTVLVVTSQISNWYYWVIGAIGLLNLYNFWWVPEISFLKNFLSFGNRLMPRVLGLVNFILFLQLYTKHFLQNLSPRKSE